MRFRLSGNCPTDTPLPLTVERRSVLVTAVSRTAPFCRSCRSTRYGTPLMWTEYGLLVSLGLITVFNLGCGPASPDRLAQNDQRDIHLTNGDVIREIAAICGCDVTQRGGFDLARLGIERDAMDASVEDYFRSQIPDIPITSKLFAAADVYRLIARDQLPERNREYIPSRDIIAAGFVTIGTDISGDAVAVDVTDGCVYLVSHEIDWEDELDHDPMANRGKVINDSTALAATIGEFLSDWRDRLREITAKETERKRAAQDQRLSFSSNEIFLFNKKSVIESVAVPDGHHTSDDTTRSTVWIKREGDRSSVVVGTVALENPRSAEAVDPEGQFVDMATETATWRFRRSAWPDFEAMLVLGDGAVSVHGGLPWTDEDIKQFLGRLKLRPTALRD